MNFAELKELLGEEGKVIVVENNKPVMVALTYEQYKKEKGMAVTEKQAEPVVEQVAEPADRQDGIVPRLAWRG